MTGFACRNKSGLCVFTCAWRDWGSARVDLTRNNYYSKKKEKSVCWLAPPHPTAVYDGVYHTHTLLGRFSMVDISTVGMVGIVSVLKRSALDISRRAFRRRLVRYWHPLGSRSIRLGKLPQGGCDKTPSYTVRHSRYPTRREPQTHQPDTNTQNPRKKYPPNTIDNCTTQPTTWCHSAAKY